MKKDYKKKFLFLTKKNNKDILYHKRFYPNEDFLKKIFKENQNLIKNGKRLKNKNQFKKAYDYATDIMLRTDDWIFDNKKLYIKNYKKPVLTFKPDELKGKKWKQQISKYHVFEFDCGNLHLRTDVNSDNDLHYCYGKIKRYFNSTKTNINKFRWGMNYYYPKINEIKKLEKTQKFGHYLLLNGLYFQAMSYNFYTDAKNTLIITSDLLKENLDPMINFISRLNKLSKIYFRDVVFEENDEGYEFFRVNLKNERFFNYFPDLKQSKLKLKNLLKLRKLINKKIKFKIQTGEFEKLGYDYTFIL